MDSIVQRQPVTTTTCFQFLPFTVTFIYSFLFIVKISRNTYLEKFVITSTCAEKTMDQKSFQDSFCKISGQHRIDHNYFTVKKKQQRKFIFVFISHFLFFIFGRNGYIDGFFLTFFYVTFNTKWTNLMSFYFFFFQWWWAYFLLVFKMFFLRTVFLWFSLN